MYTLFYGLTVFGAVIDIAVILLILSLVTFEYFALSLLLLVAVPAVIGYFGGATFSGAWDYVTQNWAELLMYFGVYIGIGVLYSLLKWNFFMKAKLPRMQELYTRYKADKNSYRSDDDIRKAVAKEVSERVSIESWVVYWPFHSFNDIAKAILVDFIKTVVSYFGNIYNAITKHYVTQLK